MGQRKKTYREFNLKKKKERGKDKRQENSGPDMEAVRTEICTKLQNPTKKNANPTVIFL